MNVSDHLMCSFRWSSLAWSLSHCLKPPLWRGLWCHQGLFCNLFQSPGLWTGILSNLLSLMWLFFTLSWSFIVCVLLCFLPNCIDQKCSQYSEVVCKLVMRSLTNFAISLFLHISVIQYSTLTVLCIIVAQHQHFNIPVSLSIESIFLPTHLSTYLSVCFLTYLSHFHFHYAM